MYRGSYNNNQGTNDPPPPRHHHHQQQSSDAYGQQPPLQQSYYQAHQPGQGQYGGQPSAGASSHGGYSHQGTHHHQQQQGYPLQAHAASGGGSGGRGVGYSSAAVPGSGPSSNAYASYGPPPPQQQHDQYQYINAPRAAAALPGLHPPQQQLQQQGSAPLPAYNQSIPNPTRISAARMDSSLPQHYPHQQHQNYPAVPQHREVHPYPPPPHAAAAAAAIPPPAPMHRVVEDPYYQFQQPGHAYSQGHSQPPAPASISIQQQQQQQQQYTRYEPEHPSSARNARNRERGGGLGSQYASETRKTQSYNSAGGGGGGGGGGRHRKKRPRRDAAAAVIVTATSSHDKEKHHHHHRHQHHKQHRSSRSPAPTDSHIRLSPTDEQATAAADAGTDTDTQYAVHLPAYQLGATPSMDYVEVSRRFERLVMPEDFIEIIRPQQQQQQQQQQQELALVQPSSPDDGGEEEKKISSIDGLGLSRVINLNGSLPLHHEICREKIENQSLALYDPDPLLTSPLPPSSPLTAPPTTAATAAAGMSSSNELPIVYNAKVVLVSGLSKEDQNTILSNITTAAAASASSSLTPPLSGGIDHLSCRLKFIVARAERAGIKSGIFALGGRVDPTIDGNPDPNPDPSFSAMDINIGTSREEMEKQKEKVLINAAKRHFLIQTGVDLSPCQRWIKVLEIKYYRPGTISLQTEVDPASQNTSRQGSRQGYLEISVIFVVDDGHRAVPSTEDWATAWEKRHVQTRLVINTSDPSLNIQENGGNQDENEKKEEDGAVAANDCEEGELPETASPLLKSTNKTTSKALEMPSEPRILFIGLNNQKLRLKTMSISLDGLLDYNENDTEEAVFEMSLFAETMHEMLSRDAGMTIYKALVEKPWEKEIETRSGDGERAMCLAFNYFDAGGLGYILAEDLQTIIECLGLHLHHGYVKELCQKAAEASGSSGKSADGGCGGKVEYSKLCLLCRQGQNVVEI
ncbi:hypothetical protein Ndes2526B_g03723 [Nannochloris sp. 'desiccata']|nr:hypothetical protein KSW81_005413 [Chlorella desiccata (nom. nud.)]KAH7621380.1 putative Cell division cycle and apoptosis regulator protein 1 [Chlorella desiccata (nom. nud.)]